MFIKEHNPPHFHAFYGEFTAAFSIETGQMIQGDFPSKKAALVYGAQEGFVNLNSASRSRIGPSEEDHSR